MSPSIVTIDTTPDLDFPMATAAHHSPAGGRASASKRTLLLAPPSIAARAERISALFATFDADTTDLQMLDRLAGGLVTLPPATYDLVLVLTDPDGSRRSEALQFLGSRAVFALLVPALKPGGRLASEDGSLGGNKNHAGSADAREAVLAGLLPGPDGFVKPKVEEEEAVPLRFGLKKMAGNTSTTTASANGAHSSAGPAVGTVTVDVGGKQETLDMVPRVPAGVGFVNLDDDDIDFLDDDDDGDLVDEDDLLTEEDRNRPPPKGMSKHCRVATQD